MSKSPQNRTIEAENFAVKDSIGRTRAHLGMQGDEPALTLYDSEENPRIVLRVTTEVAGGKVLSPHGQRGVELSLTAGSGAIGLFGSDGKPQALLLAMVDGPGLLLYDSDAKVRLRIDVRKGAAGISVYDSNERMRLLLGIVQNEPTVATLDEDEQAQATLT